jgi:hypothetical protein
MAANMETLDKADAHARAQRYVAEGRLIVQEVSPFRVKAVCRGEGHLYECGYLNKRWWCDCHEPGCAHLLALQLVVAR